MLRTARITFPSDEAFAPVPRLRAGASCASEALYETRISFSWPPGTPPFPPSVLQIGCVLAGPNPTPPVASKEKGLFELWSRVSAWLSGIIPSGAPPPTPRRSPPRGSGERRALTPLLSPNHRLFALNHLVNLLSRHMLGLTACAIPRQLDDSIPRENYPHESAKGQKKAVRVVRQGRPIKIDGLYLRQYSGSSTSSALHTSMQASRKAASAFWRLPLASIAAEASVMTWVSNPSRADKLR